MNSEEAQNPGLTISVMSEQQSQTQQQIPSRPRGGSGSRRPRGRGGRQNHTSDRNVANQQASGEEPPDGGGNARARQSRGGNRGRGRRGGASVVNGATDGQIETSQAVPSGPSNARRGRGRGGSGVRANQRGVVTSTFAGRLFGGQLTRERAVAISDGEAAAEPSTQLSAAASEFTPGSSKGTNPPIIPKVKHQRAKKQRKASLSSAPDITTRIHEDIDNRVYECCVCTSEITRRDKIWSCHTCWTVFHLTCIKKWSAKSIANKAATHPDSGDEQLQSWRCPGCNLPTNVMPNSFRCWCEKETDPQSLAGLPPFSCGQTCNRDRACPHPCSVMCHSGPCLPCPQMGPTQICFCGRESKTRRCLDTDYKNGWSCGQVCNEIMPCGEHYCGRPCHEGLCGSCDVPVSATCYCGQESHTIACSMTSEPLDSRRKDIDDNEVKVWTGLFACENTCDRKFDCGIHQCEKACHAQEEDIPHCPRSPDVVSTCPCGKSSLSEISNITRASCEDDIPLCGQPCMKKMSCGHSCQRICHTGDCFPCLSMTDISCQCGRTTVKTMCDLGYIDPPMCMRICRATLNCGRHECGNHCCTGERKAADRVATKKKLGRSLLSTSARGPDQEFEAEHICTRVCGRPLKCGSHTCQELCHRGPCNSCREAIFEEISCHCGRTVIQPPLPCGTQPPPCFFECNRTKACGHPQVSHNCHGDGEPCPKCPFLTTKPCLCGKNQLKNQPCWLNGVRCGEVCNKKLKCGYHKCRKACHKPGECEDVGSPCSQACGKEKSCGHPCSAPCHSPFPCKEDKPCEHKTFITCDCQRLKQETRCNATKNSKGNLDKSLTCDDECLRLERNRKLQLAFNIPADHQDDHIPYAADTINKYLTNPSWAGEQEKLLRAFASDPDQKRLRFKPLKAEQRAFIHCLAEDFGFDHESMDPEPHRHVAIFKTPKFVMAPMKTVADCVRIKQMQAVIHASERPKAKANNVVGDPFNAILVSKVKFGLTIEELRKTITASIPSAGQVDISFLPSDEVVLQFSGSHTHGNDQVVEAHLTSLKPALSKALTAQGLGNIELCRVDSSLNLERRESDSSTGWSQVAKSAPRRLVPVAKPLGSKSSFVVLGSQAKKKKKKKEKSIVADDWEEAEEREEEKERVSSDSS